MFSNEMIQNKNGPWRRNWTNKNKPYRVILQIISVQELKFFIRMQVIEAVAEEVNFLLNKPPSEILPLGPKEEQMLDHFSCNRTN